MENMRKSSPNKARSPLEPGIGSFSLPMQWSRFLSEVKLCAENKICVQRILHVYSNPPKNMLCIGSRYHSMWYFLTSYSTILTLYQS